jgi:hypothetical protein
MKGNLSLFLLSDDGVCTGKIRALAKIKAREAIRGNLRSLLPCHALSSRQKTLDHPEKSRMLLLRTTFSLMAFYTIMSGIPYGKALYDRLSFLKHIGR